MDSEMDVSFCEERDEESSIGTKFLVDAGVTSIFIEKSKKFVEFGDFALVFKAQITKEDEVTEGYWLCQCTSMVNRNLVSRNVVLPTSAFESKAKLMQLLRQEFKGGNFSLSGSCSCAQVQQYYKYLKKDFAAGDQRQCLSMKRIGFQDSDYWCLSDELHINNKDVVENENMQFVCIDRAGLTPFFHSMNLSLLKKCYLGRTMRRFIELSACWGVNKDSFLAAVAFVCVRLVRCDNVDGNAGEANIGMIFSKSQSVGKSKSAKILAYGQGVPQSVHNTLLAGGDQVTSGTSVKKILEALGKTSFVIVVDDAKMTDTLAETLLQIQGGLMQGSSQQGLSSPSGSVLLTSNTKETNRLFGRVLHFHFSQEPNFTKEQESEINQLFQLVCANRGIFLAWVLHYKAVFLKLEQKQLNFQIVNILRDELPGRQSRWYKGLSSIILNHVVMLQSCRASTEEGFIAFVEGIIDAHIKYNPLPKSTLERLEEIIKRDCIGDETKEKVKQWLNDSVKVNQRGSLVAGIAIKMNHIPSWTTISRLV